MNGPRRRWTCIPSGLYSGRIILSLGYLCFRAGSKQVSSSFVRERLPHSLRLLTAKTRLRHGSGKERSGPCWRARAWKSACLPGESLLSQRSLMSGPVQVIGHNPNIFRMELMEWVM